MQNVNKKLETETSDSTTNIPLSTQKQVTWGLTNTPPDCSPIQEDGKCSASPVTTSKQSEKTERGVKHDREKTRLDLLPSDAIYAVGRVLTHGCKKYGARNWENGFEWTRAIGAILRHTFSYLGGETHDPETGESHMAHVACEAMFLLTFEKTHPELDDRPKGGK